MSKTVCIMQPHYLPWLGYMDMLDQADLFVLLDTVQFQPKSWQCRNRVINLDGKPLWLTIPTSHRRGDVIADIPVDYKLPWQRKHIGTIMYSYGAAGLEPLLLSLEAAAGGLANVVAACITRLALTLRIRTPIALASEVAPGQRPGRLERLADILHATEATEMLNTAGARDVLGVDEIDGIPIRYHAYEHPVYDQGGREFVSHLSVVDALGRFGARETLELIRSGRRK